jgi:hypothetical protein
MKRFDQGGDFDALVEVADLLISCQGLLREECDVLFPTYIYPVSVVSI